MKIIALGLVAALAGCATTGTDGVVSLGGDMYMVGGLGGMMDYSASGVKARFFQQASKFCADRGQTMTPINSTGRDSGIGSYASAEVQFKCVKAE